MKLKNLILFGLLLTSRILNAQTDFRPGYIIELDGDTIHGEIDYRGDFLMSGLCKFQENETVIKDYSPNDIAAFRFIDSKYYVSKEVDGKSHFLELLFKGKVNIYYMRDEVGAHYYIDKENEKLTEIPYEEGIEYVNDRRVFYESKKHIGVLKYYMQDAPELHSRIQSVKKPEHKNMINLAEAYHKAVSEGESGIVYEKSVPLIRILPEVIVGAIKYSNVENLADKSYINAGIIGHIWMPRASEKMYFRTGVLFSQLDVKGEKINSYKIPLQLEYIYPRGVFRPRFAYGTNFYTDNYRSVSFNGGVNIKLSELLFLSLISDIEFNSYSLIVPSSLLSYSLHFGLFVNLK